MKLLTFRDIKDSLEGAMNTVIYTLFAGCVCFSVIGYVNEHTVHAMHDGMINYWSKVVFNSDYNIIQNSIILFGVAFVLFIGCEMYINYVDRNIEQ